MFKIYVYFSASSISFANMMNKYMEINWQKYTMLHLYNISKNSTKTSILIRKIIYVIILITKIKI